MTGEMEIIFSDAFIVPQDLEKIKEEPQLILTVQPIEEDQDEEQVRFDWSITRFTESKMVIQLAFEQPYEISVYEEKNYISLQIND